MQSAAQDDVRDNDEGSGVAASTCRVRVVDARVVWRAGVNPAVPEDLYCLIKKAVSVRKHLERNRKDRDAKFRLILIESRVHRLGRYYKKAGKLPPNWK